MITLIQIDPTVSRQDIITWLAIENTKPSFQLVCKHSSDRINAEIKDDWAGDYFYFSRHMDEGVKGYF